MALFSLLKKKTRFEFEVLMNTTAFFKVRTPWRRVKVFYSFRIFASLYSKVHNKEPKLSLAWWHKTTGDNATFPESDDGLSLVTRPSTPSLPPPPPSIFRNFEWKVTVADFAFYRKKKIIKSRFLEGHLNTILAPWGGHLNEPIFNSLNAPGLPWGMLELRVDRHVTSWVKR